VVAPITLFKILDRNEGFLLQKKKITLRRLPLTGAEQEKATGNPCAPSQTTFSGFTIITVPDRSA
jgi:hypothetical protein